MRNVFENKFAGRERSLPIMRPGGLDDQIDLLRDKILLLGGMTEAAVQKAVRALLERDTQLGRTVFEEDRAIDQMELEIDRLSIDILASHPENDHQLRMVVSVAKITPILERIADHAAGIAGAAAILNYEPQLRGYNELALMAETAGEMLRTALDAFTSEDAETSREVIKRDQRIDQYYARVFADLVDLMRDDPSAANGGAHLMFVAKHLERIGDYVKDICELNVYLREAVFIKHSDNN